MIKRSIAIIRVNEELEQRLSVSLCLTLESMNLHKDVPLYCCILISNRQVAPCVSSTGTGNVNNFSLAKYS